MTTIETGFVYIEIDNVTDCRNISTVSFIKRRNVSTICHFVYFYVDKTRFYRGHARPVVRVVLMSASLLIISPVILKSVSRKVFRERLHWLPMTNGKLPPDAMIGGFENELTYIARAEHNNSLSPGKYVPSTGYAFIPWGSKEYVKQHFEILCGYNAKWVKTRSNYIPQNAFIGGRSEVLNEPVYISRAMIDGKLIPGKAFARYNLGYLPYKGKEVEITSYEILVLPDEEIPQALPFID